MSYHDYPFLSQCFEVRPGIRMRYLDEGPRDAAVVVMLHGNPSWSYYWRHLVAALRDGYRCIVPDHIGMGLSDKPGTRRVWCHVTITRCNLAWMIWMRCCVMWVLTMSRR